MTVNVDRSRVLAYRVAAQGLDRAADRPAVLDLGVQDTPPGSARLALAARTPSGVDPVESLAARIPSGADPPESLAARTRPGADPPESLAVAWTIRGAPHLHHAADLPGLAAALWPLSDTDALSRVAWQRSRLAQVGMGAVDALTAVATAMRKVITAPMSKGAASTAVSAAVPPSLVAWCKPCGAYHVFESVMRLAALPAGIGLEPDTSPVRLVPIGDWPGLPARAQGVDELIRTYLRFLGPAGPAEVAAFLGSTQSELRRVWPDGLAEVEVDGRPAWLPEPLLDALAGAENPRLVRLLPPSDPYLQARDRGLLLPDRAAQKALWVSLGGPGAVLVDGEIAGVWRPRTSGRTLRITISPFGELFSDDRAAIEDEAQRVAAVRGAGRVDVVIG